MKSMKELRRRMGGQRPLRYNQFTAFAGLDFQLGLGVATARKGGEKVMGDVNKLPLCRVCGKELKEVSFEEAIIPLEVVLRVLPRNVHLASLRHFECPDRHGGVVLMPKMGDDEREQAMQDRKHYSVN
jgi:hypothetical protein